jgi:pimeloyl-ACP methyl ester carboxylesterase
MPLFSGTIRLLALAALSLAASAAAASKAAEPARIEGSVEKGPCLFDVGKALLPVDCGRLKVPENCDDPGRTIEVAFMTVHPRDNRDPQNPVIFLSGGPGSPSLVHVETLVTIPAIREIVVGRDWVFFDERGGGRSIPQLYCQPEDDWFKRVKNCRDQLIRQGVDLSSSAPLT